MRRHTALGLAALAAIMASPALADMAIATGNNPQPDENVLLNSATGNFVEGETNNTGTLIDIFGNEDLSAPAMGQARVEGADGFLTYLTISLNDPLLGFRSLILNLNADADGQVTFTANNQLGETFEDTFNIGESGENLFTLTAFNGQIFTDISFLSTVDLEDVRQIRLGGVTATTAVPEPASWALMILGLGFVGGALRRKQRQTVSYRFS